jgi:hypothetical protein
MNHFNLTATAPCDDSNTTHPPTVMCMFEPDYPEPARPFLTSEWAVFVPPPFYQTGITFVATFTETCGALTSAMLAVLWMTQRRGSLDIFVHPNSGCGQILFVFLTFVLSFF